MQATSKKGRSVQFSDRTGTANSEEHRSAPIYDSDGVGFVRDDRQRAQNYQAASSLLLSASARDDSAQASATAQHDSARPVDKYPDGDYPAGYSLPVMYASGPGVADFSDAPAAAAPARQRTGAAVA